MADKRRVTLTSYQLVNIQRALETRIEMCIFRVGSSRDDKRAELWAGECAHSIAAYRRTHAYPSGEAKSGQIANRYLDRLMIAIKARNDRHAR